MKLLVIGVGDCGCRLAGGFAQLNKTAKTKRHVSIVSRAYALNNTRESLANFAKLGPDFVQPVLIRGSLTGDTKSSESGAKLMRQEYDRVLAGMRLGGFFEADAFLFIAGAAGSVGSGGVPVIAQVLKERYVDKPIYALVIMPFDSESDDPRCLHNTATCLNAINQVADASILIDNGGVGVMGDFIPLENIANVNKEIVAPFYDLLCAGEMDGQKNAGANVLDAGDIAQTMKSWTSIGVGTAKFADTGFSLFKSKDFRDKGSETIKVMEAMNSALVRLSIDCKLENAGKALYLLTVPAKLANLDMVKALGNRLKDLAPDAEIRGGSFYDYTNTVQVSIVVSELIYVERIKSIYDRAARITGMQSKEAAETKQTDSSRVRSHQDSQ
jgi:cell division GTPase FtsZ